MDPFTAENHEDSALEDGHSNWPDAQDPVRAELTAYIAEQLANWRWDSVAPEMGAAEYIAPMLMSRFTIRGRQEYDLSGYCNHCGDTASKHDGSFCAPHYDSASS